MKKVGESLAAKLCAIGIETTSDRYPLNGRTAQIFVKQFNQFYDFKIHDNESLWFYLEEMFNIPFNELPLHMKDKVEPVYYKGRNLIVRSFTTEFLRYAINKRLECGI